MSTVSLPSQIVCWPAEVLTRAAKPVTNFDDDLRALAERMFELMVAARGVGLAAPQVGRSIRLFTCNPTQDPQQQAVYINPEIIEADGLIEAEEGCLSLPGVSVTTRRAARVVLRAVDLAGRPIERKAVDLEARAFQHEMDHLNGRLLLDVMGPTERIANRRAVKQMQETYRTAVAR